MSGPSDELDDALAACPGDRERLALLTGHVAAAAAHLGYARQLRDAVAVRLWTAGWPMARVASVARVDERYLARRAADLGAARRPGRHSPPA